MRGILLLAVLLSANSGVADVNPQIQMDYCPDFFGSVTFPHVVVAKVSKQVRTWPQVSQPSDVEEVIHHFPVLLPFIKYFDQFKNWRLYIAKKGGFDGYGPSGLPFRYFSGTFLKTTFLGMKTKLAITLRKDIDPRPKIGNFGAGVSMEIHGSDAFRVIATEVLATSESELRDRITQQVRELEAIKPEERHAITLEQGPVMATFEFLPGAKLERAVVRPNFPMESKVEVLTAEQQAKVDSFFQLSEKILAD